LNLQTEYCCSGDLRRILRPNTFLKSPLCSRILFGANLHQKIMCLCSVFSSRSHALGCRFPAYYMFRLLLNTWFVSTITNSMNCFVELDSTENQRSFERTLSPSLRVNFFLLGYQPPAQGKQKRKIENAKGPKIPKILQETRNFNSNREETERESTEPGGAGVGDACGGVETASTNPGLGPKLWVQTHTSVLPKLFKNLHQNAPILKQHSTQSFSSSRDS